MSDGSSYLDTIKHKLKHMTNKHIDKLGKMMKFNTQKDEDNINFKSKPKLIKHEKSALRIFLTNFFVGFVVALLIIQVNANITYIIKNYQNLNSWFPSVCSAYPYGTADDFPCNPGGLTPATALRLAKGLEAATAAKAADAEAKKAKTRDEIHSIGGGGKDGSPQLKPAIPYSFYKYKADPEGHEGLLSNFGNFIIGSLANTNTEVIN